MTIRARFVNFREVIIMRESSSPYTQNLSGLQDATDRLVSMVDILNTFLSDRRYFMAVDEDGTILFVSNNWAEVLKCGLEDLIGSNFLDWVAPDEFEKTEEFFLSRRDQVLFEDGSVFSNIYLDTEGIRHEVNWNQIALTPAYERNIFYGVCSISE